jgi:hypothetical protein
MGFDQSACQIVQLELCCKDRGHWVITENVKLYSRSMLRAKKALSRQRGDYFGCCNVEKDMRRPKSFASCQVCLFF